MTLLVEDWDPEFQELPLEVRHQASRFHHLVVLPSSELLPQDRLKLIWIPHMDFLILIQDPVMIHFTTVNRSPTILMVVHQIFDTTTQGMEDSTPGIGIIRPQHAFMLLAQALMLHATLQGGGGWRAALI